MNMATTSIARAEHRPSIRSILLAAVIGLTRTRDTQFDPASFVEVPSTREHYAPPRRIFRKLKVTEESFHGWPVFTLAPKDGGTAKALYLHGGAWAAEIRTGHWNLIAKLADETDRTFVVPIYPLVPAVTHREIAPILQALWVSIATDGATALLGDSAGATMALNLLRRLSADEARPDMTILLCPALDISLSNPDIDRVAGNDPLLRADHLLALAQLYAGADGIDNPDVNPMRSNLEGLGDVTVFTGTRDILNLDVSSFFDRGATASGTNVTVEEMTGMLHDWMLMPIPEALTTTSQIADLLKRAR